MRIAIPAVAQDRGCGVVFNVPVYFNKSVYIWFGASRKFKPPSNCMLVYRT